MPQQRIILDLNVKAPDIDTTDIYERHIRLSNYLGKKVFIGFFRHAGCPFCNLRVHALKKMHQTWQSKGLEMVFLFESPKALLKSSTFHEGISPIPLIADPKREYYERYGVEQSWKKSAYSHLTQFISTAIKAGMDKVPMHMMASGESFNTMPAEFLLDEQHIIRRVHYAATLNDRMSMEVIEEFLNIKNQI